MFRSKKLEEKVKILEEKVENLLGSKDFDPSAIILTAMSAFTSNSGSVSKFEFDALKDMCYDMDKRLTLLESKSSCKNCKK